MLIVGLTGNFGMGKSTVLGMLRELGAIILKADEIVDGLLHDEGVLARLREILGDDIVAGKGLSKAKVAARIFHSERLRDAVEGILHPLVFEKIDDFLGSLDRGGSDDRIVVVEVPLLFEKEYAGRFQKTVTVFADEEIAMRRLEKAGISREDATARLRAQMPVREKMRLADFTIDNSSALQETRDRVADLYSRLVEEMKRKHNCTP